MNHMEVSWRETKYLGLILTSVPGSGLIWNAVYWPTVQRVLLIETWVGLLSNYQVGVSYVAQVLTIFWPLTYCQTDNMEYFIYVRDAFRNIFLWFSVSWLTSVIKTQNHRVFFVYLSGYLCDSPIERQKPHNTNKAKGYAGITDQYWYTTNMHFLSLAWAWRKTHSFTSNIFLQTESGLYDIYFAVCLIRGPHCNSRDKF